LFGSDHFQNANQQLPEAILRFRILLGIPAFAEDFGKLEAIRIFDRVVFPNPIEIRGEFGHRHRGHIAEKFPGEKCSSHAQRYAQHFIR